MIDYSKLTAQTQKDLRFGLETRLQVSNSRCPENHFLRWKFNFFLESQLAGYATLQVNSGKIYWEDFQPHQHLRGFFRRGWGTLTHLEVLTLLGRFYDPLVQNYLVVHDSELSVSREKHLRAMGLDWHQPLLFPLHTQKVKHFAQEYGY